MISDHYQWSRCSRSTTILPQHRYTPAARYAAASNHQPQHPTVCASWVVHIYRMSRVLLQQYINYIINNIYYIEDSWSIDWLNWLGFFAVLCNCPCLGTVPSSGQSNLWSFWLTDLGALLGVTVGLAVTPHLQLAIQLGCVARPSPDHRLQLSTTL